MVHRTVLVALRVTRIPAVEPICPDPIAFLPPYVSDIRLAQPFSASSSTTPGRIPSLRELQEELKGQARMATKVQEAENKRASKARIREGERGQWWPCETTDVELRELHNEGMISAYWSFIRDTDVPKPGADEVVMTKAWVERGLSLPCSKFFLSILSTYGLQPHNICPNSYLLLSNFATLCEGHLGIRPDVKLWQFFFRVKKETKDKAMVNCGSMTFMLRPGRMYPPHDSHESVRYWNAGWFYEKNASVPTSTTVCPSSSTSLRKNSRAGARSLTRSNPYPGESSARISCSILWRSKTFAPFFMFLLAATGRRRFRMTKKRKRNRHLVRRPLDLRSVPAPKPPAQKPSQGQASAKKPKTVKPPPLNSKKAEQARLKMLATAGKRSRPIIPAPLRQAHLTLLLKRPPLKLIVLPLLPLILHRKLFRLVARRWAEKILKTKDLLKTNQECKVKEKLKSLLPKEPEPVLAILSCFPKNFGDPTDLTSTPKAYTTKFFNKLTEAEKWELEQDLLNAMLNNAGKPDVATSEIQDFKKDVGSTNSSAAKAHPRPLSQPPNLRTRSSYQDLETKLKEAELKKEQAEKQLAEKNSEHAREKGEFVLKRNADSETIKKQESVG
ncbi:hypothetical protein QYE76_062354 [Lolium multiflorum]|uniref:Transposase (putative) gypsy type domain-containing protein n=1 Tax=Lolium multiflorum TaxID=4521 RepID=A0AAD8S2V8_LOLMU|nr:hypothetical protein QYE76_062354 [Lolium multiflorum]